MERLILLFNVLNYIVLKKLCCTQMIPCNVLISWIHICIIVMITKNGLILALSALANGEFRDISWLSTSLAVIGRVSMAGCFSLMWLYTSELFPTVIRWGLRQKYLEYSKDSLESPSLPSENRWSLVTGSVMLDMFACTRKLCISRHLVSNSSGFHWYVDLYLEGIYYILYYTSQCSCMEHVVYKFILLCIS